MLVELLRPGPDPEDVDGEGGAEGAALWPPAGVANLEILRDAVRLDPGDHDAERGVVVVEEALWVNLDDGPQLAEAILDALRVLVLAQEVHRRQIWPQAKAGRGRNGWTTPRHARG